VPAVVLYQPSTINNEVSMPVTAMPLILQVPDENILSAKALNNEVARIPLMLQVPDEIILSISSFLSIYDIRPLASTCRSVRATLIASQGAVTCIWMRRLQEAFPEVFRPATGTTFAIDHQLRVSRPTGTSYEINLPLLTHLLPKRYPRSIDPSTLKSVIGPHPFRSYEAELSISPKVGTKVRLVQFDGQVGTGNRSIRSEQPFPSVCNCYSESAIEKYRRIVSKSKRKMPFKLKLKCGHRQNDVNNVHRPASYIGHFREASDYRDYLRPFVVPTVVSDTRSCDRNDDIRLLIDLTPRLVAFFEVSITVQSQDHTSPENIHHDYGHECVSIGLSTKSFCPQGNMPGWDLASYGYHSDDGGMFHGIPPKHGRPLYGPGDTVGCGLEYISSRIFFTKNGKFLGYEFNVGKDVVESGLYPTVGVDSECPIFVNFGERPFCFDLNTIGL
jgi:hypothetical protein